MKKIFITLIFISLIPVFSFGQDLELVPPPPEMPTYNTPVVPVTPSRSSVTSEEAPRTVQQAVVAPQNADECKVEYPDYNSTGEAKKHRRGFRLPKINLPRIKVPVRQIIGGIFAIAAIQNQNNQATMATKQQIAENRIAAQQANTQQFVQAMQESRQRIAQPLYTPPAPVQFQPIFSPPPITRKAQYVYQPSYPVEQPQAAATPLVYMHENRYDYASSNIPAQPRQYSAPPTIPYVERNPVPKSPQLLAVSHRLTMQYNPFESYAPQGETISVSGYTRQDGTYVAPSHKTKPDSYQSNNWSSQGNVNPFTGEKGYRKTTHKSLEDW